MAVTGSGTFARSAQAQDSGHLSLSSSGILQVTANGLADLGSFSVVIGETTTSSPPSTLAGLANTTVYPFTDTLWATSQGRHVASTYSASVVFVGAVADPGWTVGHYAWAAVFPSASPSSGDAPSFLIGPAQVVA